jgi:hypothetical protein
MRLSMKRKSQPAKYDVPQPTELESCIEFEIDSRSHNQELSGVIQIRAEPERLGVRWAGEKVWTWLEWHDLMALGADWPATVKQIVAEKYELAYEEGLRYGLEEAAKSPEQAAAEHRKWVEEHAIHVVRGPKVSKMMPPDDAA